LLSERVTMAVVWVHNYIVQYANTAIRKSLVYRWQWYCSSAFDRMNLGGISPLKRFSKLELDLLTANNKLILIHLLHEFKNILLKMSIKNYYVGIYITGPYSGWFSRVICPGPGPGLSLKICQFIKLILLWEQNKTY
jgi:hypothetical protein